MSEPESRAALMKDGEEQAELFLAERTSRGIRVLWQRAVLARILPKLGHYMSGTGSKQYFEALSRPLGISPTLLAYTSTEQFCASAQLRTQTMHVIMISNFNILQVCTTPSNQFNRQVFLSPGRSTCLDLGRHSGITTISPTVQAHNRPHTVVRPPTTHIKGPQRLDRIFGAGG